MYLTAGVAASRWHPEYGEQIALGAPHVSPGRRSGNNDGISETVVPYGRLCKIRVILEIVWLLYVVKLAITSCAQVCPFKPFDVW
jgi:hypothetical protein